jgi:hypothetical protein
VIGAGLPADVLADADDLAAASRPTNAGNS